MRLLTGVDMAKEETVTMYELHIRCKTCGGTARIQWTGEANQPTWSESTDCPCGHTNRVRLPIVEAT